VVKGALMAAQSGETWDREKIIMGTLKGNFKPFLSKVKLD